MSGSLSELNIRVLADVASAISDMGRAQAAVGRFADESAASLREVSRNFGEMRDSISEVGTVIAEVAGIALGFDAFKEMARQAFETAEKVDHLSQSLGVSTQVIQQMSYAAGLVGADLDTASQAFARLEKSSEQAAAGSAQQAEAFRAIGISASQLTDLLKQPDELIRTVAEHLSQFGDGTGKTAVVMELFGRNAAQLIPYLNALGKDFEDLEEQATAFGLVLSGENQRLLASTQEAFNLIGQQVKGLGNELGVSLAPALKELSKDFGELLSSAAVRDALKEIGAAFKLVADNVGLLSAAIELLVAKQLVGWALSAAASIAAVSREVIIGASVWAEMTGAAVTAEVAMAGLTAAGEGLLAAVGGIPGVLALVGIGIYELATYSDGATKASKDLAEAQRLLANTTADTVTQDVIAARATEKKIEAELRDAQAILATLEAQNAANASIKFGATQSDIAALAYSATAGRIETLRGHIDALQKSLRPFADGLQTAQADALQFNNAVAATSRSFVAGDLAGNMTRFVEGSNRIHAATAVMIADGADAALAHAQEDAAIRKLSESLDRASLEQVNYNGHVAALKETVDTSAKGLIDLQAVLDELSGKAGDEYDKAWATYNADLAEVTKAYAEAITGADDYTQADAMLTEGLKRAEAAWQKRVEIIDALKSVQQTLGDSVEQLLGTYAQEEQALTLSEAERAKVNAELQAEKQVREAVTAAIKAGHPEYAKELEDLIARGKAHADFMVQMKEEQDLLKSWAQTAQSDFDSAFSAINKDIIEGGSVMKDLVSLSKTVVEQIILEFEKLAIINPLLKEIFGASAVGNLPDLSTAGGVFGNILNGNGSLLGNVGSLFGLGGAGINATSGLGVIGSSDALGLVPDYLGAGAEGVYGGELAGAGAGAGSSSVFGTIAPMLGAFTLGDRLGGGGAGGAAAGIGLAAAAYFVPVIGWIAAAVQVADMLTGGNILGGSKKPWGGTETFNLGPEGADVSAMEQFKKKGALFSGNHYSWQNIPAPAGDVNALDQFYTSARASIKAIFDRLGAETPDMIAGSFKQTFDKNGKLTSTLETILGQSFTGETAQQFESRDLADTILAGLDKLGLGASQFVAGLQGNADKLLAATQDFATVAIAASTDLANGFKFLALSGNATLADVIKWTEGQQQAGETLTQTYARLEQAQAQYNQFVAQFKPGTTYVDDFEAAFSKLYHTMLQNMDAANALAQAAGASGASTEDLTNIQHAYAQQMAALTAQLEQSAQALAFSLGVTIIGTLDQVNSAIQAITGSVSGTTDDIATTTATATQSVKSFGRVMVETAQKASDAINLLLGNLSPLNDQQKLQIALQGLRAGTVTQEQVLQIGRNLYASSEAYNQLFAEVQQYAQRKGGGGGGFKGIPAVIASSVNSADVVVPPKKPDEPPGGLSADEWKRAGISLGQFNKLSPDDQQKLISLLKEQTTLQASQTATQFNTLARQIAEIASAKGETFQQVIDEMGINNAALEKGLNIKSDADLNAYLKNLQDQQDSAHEDVLSIIAAINLLPQGIAAAINSFSKTDPTRTFGLPKPTPAIPPAVPAPVGGGVSPGPIGARGGYRQSDAEVMSAAVAQFGGHVRELGAGFRRNNR